MKMKRRTSFPVILMFAVTVCATGLKAEKQPLLHNALDRLRGALRHVMASANGAPKKHLDDATVALRLAKSNLDDARKNKGSHARVASEKVVAAIAAVEAVRGKPENREKATQAIQAAIDETLQAVRAGK